MNTGAWVLQVVLVAVFAYTGAVNILGRPRRCEPISDDGCAAPEASSSSPLRPG